MLAQHLDTFTRSAGFQRFIIGLILLAGLVVGLETSPAVMDRYGRWLHLIDQVIIYLFALEALLKMGARGRRPWAYFKDPWNCFDFTIVVLCLLPATGGFAAVMRLARILRVLRLVTVIPRLQLIVASLLKGLPSMGYVGLLLLLLFYIYGVTGVFLFRENDPVRFGHLGQAMLTLFQVVTMDDWVHILYTQMHGSDVYPPPVEAGEFDANPEAQPGAAITYFVSFVLLGTIIILNLVIGVIFSAMQEAQADRERAELAKMRQHEGGLSMAEEIDYLEHQLEEFRHHLHILRARVEEEPGSRSRPGSPPGGSATTRLR